MSIGLKHVIMNEKSQLNPSNFGNPIGIEVECEDISFIVKDLETCFRCENTFIDVKPELLCVGRVSICESAALGSDLVGHADQEV